MWKAIRSDVRFGAVSFMGSLPTFRKHFQFTSPGRGTTEASSYSLESLTLRLILALKKRKTEMFTKRRRRIHERRGSDPEVSHRDRARYDTSETEVVFRFSRGEIQCLIPLTREYTQGRAHRAGDTRFRCRLKIIILPVGRPLLLLHCVPWRATLQDNIYHLTG